jgi:flagellar hook-associated protein 1 FlgK
MSFGGSLSIGRTALQSSQVAIQVTGNNFANASTPGFSRQRVDLVALQDQRWGQFQIGRGVGIGNISRQIDQALVNRLNGAIADQGAADVGQNFLSQVESVINELGSNSLSDIFNQFFDSWSELANSPNRDGARALVVQQGRTLAGAMRNLRSDLSGARTQLDQQLYAAVGQANAILDQIATLNVQIVNAEGGVSEANSLRDQRDQLVTQLSRFADVSVVQQDTGSIDILIGSTPVLLNNRSRGLQVDTRVTPTGRDLTVGVRDDGTTLSIRGGTIGGLLEQRGGTVQRTMDSLDSIAAQLIFEVNRVHSSGYATDALTGATGTRTVPAADVSRALNDPANQTFAELPFSAVNGGFLVTVRNSSTGASQTVRINVDLDGLTSAGAPGFADDTSVQSLAADLSGVANLSATVNPDGTLSVRAAPGFSVGFAEDSSGVLAVLGLNSYFTGTSAENIDVRAELVAQPRLLSTGVMVNGQPTDNGAALAVAGLRTRGLTALGGASVAGAWRDTAQIVGADAQAASTRAAAAKTVADSLEAQRQGVSGVSIDEESVNLLNYQRMYQGAARFISTVDELTQTLLSMAQ